MANDLASFMTYMSDRFTKELSFSLRPQAAFLSAISINPTSETLPPNRKVTVNMAAIDGDGVDALTSAPAIRDVDTTGTELELTKLWSLPFSFSEVDMARAWDNPALMDSTLEQVAIKAITYANAQTAALFTTTNFDSTLGGTANTTRTSTPTAGADMTLAEVGAMRTVLATRGVPLTRGDLFAITHPIIYGKWTTEAGFASASNIGDEWASRLRSTATVGVTQNFLPLEDAQVPKSGTSPDFTYTSAFFHRAAVIMVSAIMPKPDSVPTAYLTIPLGDKRGQVLSVRVTAQFSQNIGATGGSKTVFLAEAFMGFHVHRPELGVLHTTVLETP